MAPACLIPKNSRSHSITLALAMALPSFFSFAVSSSATSVLTPPPPAFLLKSPTHFSNLSNASIPLC